MNVVTLDIDPLSSYEYPYDYENIPEPYPYVQDVKNECHYQYGQNYQHTQQSNVVEDKPPEVPAEKIVVEKNADDTAKSDVKQDLKPVLEDEQKPKAKKSNYWSIKIKEKNFSFYGCALCNISYCELQMLDQHMTTHKDRLTSYDLRVKNQIKRKKIKKEKKIKKRIKIEKTEDGIEIKPEEGFIGEEKASNYNNDKVMSDNDKQDNDERKDNNANRTKKRVGKKVELLKKQCTDDLQKIYKCFACGKQFTLSYYLRLHVRSHTDEKPYTCAECGQSFITASKLGRHNKRIHLAIRYQCRICYKFFSQFDLLKRHFDKKHADDKLEGEPYDYNAILPYLKELEEELKEKSEKEKQLKTEETWPDQWQAGDKKPDTDTVETDMLNVNVQQAEVKTPLDGVVSPPRTVVADVLYGAVKLENEDDNNDDVTADDVTADDLKDDSNSDEDYFPSNTWATVSPAQSPQPASNRRASGKLTCQICNKTISSVTYMKVHLRTHSGERPFKCYICDRGFITSSKMHRHVLTHNEENEIHSLGDGADATGLKEEKPKKKRGRIKKKEKADLPKIKEKHKKRPHSCEFCNKRFLHLATLQVHKKCHEGETLTYKCEYCLEDQPDEEALRLHEATHGGAKPYTCTLCGKNYKRKTTMVHHRQHHRADQPALSCPACPKRFHSERKLQRHAARHGAARSSLRYECPVCAHMFHTRYHALMHLKSHLKEGLIQEENRPEIVAMLLQNARRLPQDPGAVPSAAADDERSRVCNICGEVFQHFYYLEEHLKSHGSRIAIEDLDRPEEKRYTCTVCQKSFKLHYYLKLHGYTHSKEKPYICQQCGKGFITKGKLKRHLETHSGLKKYQCHICYKFFTRPSYLRIHVRTIHGTQDYNFKIDKINSWSRPGGLPLAN
ncbi:zinc finger protein 572-like [Bombyx mandarina]|uniref:Zinc finger protein 572-like n=1 Tax=Bombyx mandarina TaxID=7092 RepID=A0A6J2KB46_BOMMA|nr:zinc finger protein 572-like [Bombyx mandarina]